MNGEDGSDRCVDVDVPRTIERIELQYVLALWVLPRDRNRLLDLLAAHHTDVAAGFDGVNDRAVGELVEFLHLLALNVGRPGEPEDVRETCPAHPTSDDLRGQADLLKKASEITCRLGHPALAVEQMSL